MALRGVGFGSLEDVIREAGLDVGQRGAGVLSPGVDDVCQGVQQLDLLPARQIVLPIRT